MKDLSVYGNVAKTGIDYAVAPTVTVAAVLGYMPAIAALLGVIWYAIRIWQTCSVQRFIGRTDRVCIGEPHERTEAELGLIFEAKLAGLKVDVRDLQRAITAEKNKVVELEVLEQERKIVIEAKVKENE